MRGRIHKVALAGWRGISYLDLEFDEGPLTALVGEPGAGKSTAAMLLCHALLPDRRVLKIHSLSEVQDKQQSGKDPVSSRIDPLVGFAYVLLEIRSDDGRRVIAGIHVQEADGEGDFTCIELQGVPDDWPLQDCLRILDGDDEIYPDLNDLAASLAARGVMLRQLKTVREYGEVLYAAGIVPCDYSDPTERRLFARLIESTFRGGLSPEVAGQLKEYMLPPATRLPDSVDRLQRCADTLMRTHSALEESERQLKLLELTYGLGKRIVVTSIAKVSQSIRSDELRLERGCIEVETHRKSASALSEAIDQTVQIVQSAHATKNSIEDQFRTDLSLCNEDQQHWNRKVLENEHSVGEARQRIARFREGQKAWLECRSGSSSAVTYADLYADLQGAIEVEARRTFELETQIGARKERRKELTSGMADTASTSLARALNTTAIAEAFEDSTESEARSLELSLGGLVQGVIGSDVNALAALADDPAFPDTFWLRASVPEKTSVHEVGPWCAVSMPGGFVVTSRRRRLTLGRHARQLELASLEMELEAIEEQRSASVEQSRALEKRREHLLLNAGVIQAYLANSEGESTLAAALAEAISAHAHAQETYSTALKRTAELNVSREQKVAGIELQLSELREKKSRLDRRFDSAQEALERSRALIEETKKEIASAEDLLRRMKELVGAPWDWLSIEASGQEPLSESDFVSRQTRDLTQLGSAFADEVGERMEWLRRAEPQDQLTLCAIWAPLREIVSERINVDSLEADGINLIADMAERRRTLSFKLDADRAEMRAQAHSLYTTIITEIRKQETRIKQLSAFGDSLNFGNVSGMQIVTHRKRDLLDLLHSVAKQIDLFASQSNVPLDAHLNDIFAKTLGTRFDGQALLDYRTYLDVTIEVRRNNQWESATGLSGGESIGGGLALSLMLARSLAIRGSLGRGRHFTPIFVVDEVQRLNAAGQALIVEFGRRQGFQVIVTGLSLDASFPCTMHVMSRHFRPQETVVARRVKVAAQDAA